MHAATSIVENSAQGPSCQLKFVDGLPFKQNIYLRRQSRAISTIIETGVACFRFLKTITNGYKDSEKKVKLWNGVKCKREESEILKHQAGNTKGGSITVLLTSCLTGWETAV